MGRPPVFEGRSLRILSTDGAAQVEDDRVRLRGSMATRSRVRYATPRGRAIRLIAVTGCAQPDDRRRALEAGFDAHVVKPAPLDVLRGPLAS